MQSIKRTHLLALACLFLIILITGGFVKASAQEESSQPATSSAAGAAPLDYEFFRTKVQPIFLRKRPGHARCFLCHSDPRIAVMRLSPLTPGSGSWTEEQSRKNFEAVKHVAFAGNLHSPILLHPLATEAGGDLVHTGGKHFASQEDPEWLTLKAFVMGEKAPAGSPMVTLKPRVIQTNFASDKISIIDPDRNVVVGEILGIELGHGVAIAPNGKRIYVSDEADQTLDVVDASSLRVTKKIPLTSHPNNIAMSHDGSRMYVALVGEGDTAGLDEIDTATETLAKHIVTGFPTHNPYVTPDGRYLLAGSQPGKNVSVIDMETDKVAWTAQLDLGVRPMTMSVNPDGSTKWIFVQLTKFDGFSVVDFATHKEINRITNPPTAPGKKPVPGGGEYSHGMAVTKDQKTLLVCSRISSAVYFYSLPDLKLIGTADLGGKGPGWLSLSPDGKKAYIANSITNNVSVIDVASMKEIALIPVGYTPKRNTSGWLE